MKKIAILLVLIFSISQLKAQVKENYSDYRKKEIFNDDFVDNHNDWHVYYTRIKKGKYLVETIGKDMPSHSTIPIKIDDSRNYEIEVKVSIEWNRSKEYMGIVWNRDLNNGYYLGFNKNLETISYIMIDDEVMVKTQPKKLGLLHAIYTPNTITIRKIEQTYLVFINKVLAYKIPYEDFYGDHIGFFVGTASELRVNKMTVSYLM